MTSLVCGYIGSPPSGRRDSGGCRGQQPGAVVVPAGSGLVAASPAGPAQAEGEAGAGDEPGGVLPGQAFDAGGLGDGEPDRGDAGRAGLSAPSGDGRVPERDAQVRADVVAVVTVVVAACAGGGVREGDVAAQVVADSCLPQLRQGGQGGVPADRVPGAGLALVPAKEVLPGLERFFSRPLLIPVKKKSSLAFRVHPGRY